MSELKPITHKERIMAGEDITPITREEMFLKQMQEGDGGGTPEYDAEVTFVYDDGGSIACTDTFANQYALGNGVSKVVFVENGVPVYEDICFRNPVIDFPDTPAGVAYTTKSLKFTVDSETQIVAENTAVKLNSDNSVVDNSDHIYINIAT